MKHRAESLFPLPEESGGVPFSLGSVELFQRREFT